MGECRFGKEHSLICVKACSVVRDSTLEWCEVCGMLVRTEFGLDGGILVVKNVTEKIPQIAKEFLVAENVNLKFAKIEEFSLVEEVKIGKEVIGDGSGFSELRRALEKEGRGGVVVLGPNEKDEAVIVKVFNDEEGKVENSMLIGKAAKNPDRLLLIKRR